MLLMEFDQMAEVLRALEDEGVRYAVFGGAALNLHGIARFTEDVDLFILATSENVEALKAALSAVFDDPEIDGILAEDLLGEFPAVQYIPPSGGFHLDILTRLGEAFEFGDLEIVRMPFADFEISVVSPRTLYEMKRDTVRLRDRADAALLRERFNLGDE
jgi:Domain of unknown function (DUF1814).